jgi:exonuclease III
MGKGHFSSAGYKVYYSGHETKRLNAVAIIVAKKMVETVQEYKPINDRIIYIRIRAIPENLSITQVYAPTSKASEEEIEQFYEQLQDIISEIPWNNVSFIIGDFNAKVDNQIAKGITGRFGLGTRHERGDKLIEFCMENSLFVANTLFQQPTDRLHTCTSPDGRCQNQIDYILGTHRWKSTILVSKTIQAADCGYDHELLIATTWVKLKRSNEHRQMRSKLDLEHIPEEYKHAAGKGFETLEVRNPPRGHRLNEALSVRAERV